MSVNNNVSKLTIIFEIVTLVVEILSLFNDWIYSILGDSSMINEIILVIIAVQCIILYITIKYRNNYHEKVRLRVNHLLIFSLFMLTTWVLINFLVNIF